MSLNEATHDDILNNSGLYSEMIRIMKAVDGKAPAGSCCGKNKQQHINTFLVNKEKYVKMTEAIKNRKYVPKWKGIIYVAKLHTHIDARTMTDAKAKMLIEQNILVPGERFFDIAEEEKQEEKKEEVLEIIDLPAEEKVEEKVEAPVEKKNRKKKSANKKK